MVEDRWIIDGAGFEMLANQPHTQFPVVVVCFGRYLKSFSSRLKKKN